MRAFVTGSTGLLGNNLVRLLVQQGHDVTALVRSPAKAQRVFAGLDVTLIEGDMQHVAGFAAALDGSDVLFHTAAYFREYYQPGDHWQTLKAINIDGTVALLQAAEQHGVKKVIYTSSSGVIGVRPGSDWGDETTPADAYVMDNLYFKSKVLAEEAVQQFLQQSSLPVVLILPGWMFGPSDAAPTASGQLVLDFLDRKLPGVIPGGGMPVDVRDVAQAMISAVAHGASGERYLVGGERFVSMAELNQTLERVSGVPAPRRRIPRGAALAVAWASEMWSRISGTPTLITVSGVRTLLHRRLTRSDKARRVLGVTFRPLEETLRDEVAWFRQHRPEQLGGAAGQPQAAGAEQRG